MSRRLVTSNFVSLAQLAVDSGGRYTENTNDLSLAYARAQRDLSCSYTVGFYHDGIIEDKIQNVSVHVRKPGLRVTAPNKYVFRSDPVRRESMLRAAWFAPEQFATGVVQAHAFPIRPASRKIWDTLLAVSFPIPLEELVDGDQTREFGAVLYDGSRVVGQFGRRLTVRPENTDAHGVPRITILERAQLKPGRYTLTVVLSDPGAVAPDATKVAVTVPEVPRRELFLVGPILARTSGPNLTVVGDPDGPDRVGGSQAFEPLLVLQHTADQDLLALTQACAVGKRKDSKGAQIQRRLHSAGGESVGALEAVALSLEGDGKVRCQNMLDVVPANALGDGEYVFEAVLQTRDGGSAASERVRFAVDGGRSRVGRDRP